MAGDFYDVFRTAPNRLAAVIGDVTGHGIEPSITAFQAKYLLRVFLRQYRDPAQALEELNAQMSAQGRGEEFISLCVVVFDTERRHAAVRVGRPPAGLALARPRGAPAARHRTAAACSTPTAQLHQPRDRRSTAGDLLLLYTDGLAEARDGEQLFGEERIASVAAARPGRRAPTCSASRCSRRPATSPRAPLNDDVAILAIRRT